VTCIASEPCTGNVLPSCVLDNTCNPSNLLCCNLLATPLRTTRLQGQVVTCIVSEPCTGNIWTGHTNGLICLHVHGQ
jgi:hypothetical protein